MQVPHAEASEDGIDRPAAWLEAVEHIVTAQSRRVLILGPRDAGKSTFAREILRASIARGRDAALLDTDVGQKSVGPPACVTLGQVAPEGDLALVDLAFVGATDPVRGWRETIRGAARLLRTCEASLVAINTGGLLAGPGRRLKAGKIGVLEPDLLVAIGEDPGLDLVLADHPALPALRLAPSSRARRKTEGERRSARCAAFRAYFEGAEERAAPRQAFDTEDASEGPPCVGMLTGLTDASGRDIGLGLIARVDPEAGRLAYRVPAGTGPVARLRGSRVLLDEAFRDRRPTGG
jgi:polynucleotide 5'-hydroxyl-kinase GRC3/NOL9